MKKIINVDQAPAAIGPYSQAIEKNGMVFVSGQLPIDPQTGEFSGDTIESQTRQSIENILAILNGNGMDISTIVKTTVYLKNINDFAKMNEVYGAFFSEEKPARAAFEVAALPKDALVEIEVIAIR